MLGAIVVGRGIAVVILRIARWEVAPDDGGFRLQPYAQTGRDFDDDRAHTAVDVYVELAYLRQLDRDSAHAGVHRDGFQRERAQVEIDVAHTGVDAKVERDGGMEAKTPDITFARPHHHAGASARFEAQLGCFPPRETVRHTLVGTVEDCPLRR